jgi:two-component system phosphate regulon response regulator PhoB
VSGADGEQHLSFEARDWQELQLFAEGHGPPSVRSNGTHRSDPVTVTPPPDCSVLVVDDDPDVQEVVTAVLRAKGFVVKSVESAEEALSCVRDTPPRLLLVDWNLPGMSGVDLCRCLRQDESLADTPVVFLTSHSSQEDLLAAFAAGADDFVTKPFRAHELGARMLGLLERRWGSLRCAG